MEEIIALKKYVLTALLGLAFIPSPTFAQISIRIGPPPVIVEHPGPPPGAGFVWISGYHRWDGARYVWMPGHYDRPPRLHAVWVPHRWEHRHDGWVMVEGHWR